MTQPSPYCRERFNSHLRLLLCALAVALSCSSLAAQSAPETDTLRKLNSSVEALIKQVSPSVVQIVAAGYGTVQQSNRGNANVIIGRQHAIGSGFIIDPSGYILTNAHVVNGAEHVQVILPVASGDSTPSNALAYRGDILPARIIGIAPDADLAVLKVEGKNLPALRLADYAGLQQGQLVFAFGSPEGLQNSVSMGVVSATARQTDPDSPMVYVQTDAPINPGNSGGPLVNVNGEVVGINTFILSQSGGNEGLGFAIPSAIIGVSFQQIRQLGHVHRGEIGIGVQTISPLLAAALHLPRNSGVIVSDVIPGSPAAAAGLQIQDIILTVDGQATDSLPYFGFRMMTHGAGELAHLEVLRGSARLKFDVPVIQRPHEVDQLASFADPEKSLIAPLGVLCVAINQQIVQDLPGLRDPYGILVIARSAEATADIPLITGDVIRTFNGAPMTTLDNLRDALKAVPPGGSIALQIQRDDRLAFLTFTLDQP
jgi:serine protease Do